VRFIRKKDALRWKVGVRGMRVENLLGNIEAVRETLEFIERRTLENEAAVQLYMNPIPETILSLFRGRLNNMPEHVYHGTIAGSGRCEFSITFHGRLIHLFIEVKHKLSYNPQEHSKWSHR
jgi:hypothetical protein